MARRDPIRQEKLRVAIRYLLQKGELEKGSQAQLARHFGVTRQRVHQLVNSERTRVEADRAQMASVDVRGA